MHVDHPVVKYLFLWSVPSIAGKISEGLESLQGAPIKKKPKKV